METTITIMGYILGLYRLINRDPYIKALKRKEVY